MLLPLGAWLAATKPAPASRPGGSGREIPRPVNWPTGIALGVGGLAGAYLGARRQSRLPDLVIRRVVGVLVVLVGARYLWAGLG